MVHQHQLPPISEILDNSTDEIGEITERELTPKVEKCLADFGATTMVRNIHCNPRFTQFSLTWPPNVQVAKVKRLEQDLAVALAASLAQPDGPKPGYLI